MSIVMKCLSANHRVAVGRHCATTTAICRSRSNGPESAAGVRRGKAAFSSGCKPHPANAPAGSNRSSHGGDEMAEAFGIACHE